MDSEIHASLRQCTRCSASISGRRRDAKYCSRSCGSLARNELWRDKNRDRKRAQAVAWRNRNIDKARAYYYQHAEKHKAAARAWMANNAERRRAYMDAHYRTNRAYYLANAKLRKKSVRRATPPWLTAEHRAAIVAIYATAKTLGHHVDHIVPLQGETVCGLHVPWNLQTLPGKENRAKSNKHAA